MGQQGYFRVMLPKANLLNIHYQIDMIYLRFSGHVIGVIPVGLRLRS